jgi:hypothetical protein
MNELLPIIPRSNLFLVRYDHGNEERFSTLFKAAWKQIPLSARRQMLGHWRGEDEAKPLCAVIRMPRGVRSAQGQDVRKCLLSPRIELLHGWTGGRSDDKLFPGMGDHRGEVAGVFGKGHLMRFCAPLVDRMPDDVVHDLVGHELAHVYQHAVGYDRMFGYEPGHGELEENADELMESWGFRIDSVDEWAVSVGLAKRIECKNPGEYFERLLGPGSRYYNPPTQKGPHA